MTSTVSLDGAWTLRFGPQQVSALAMERPEPPVDYASIPAVVPGNVELDLIRAGRLATPLERGETIYALRPFEAYQWWFSRTVEIPAAPEGHDAELVFDGLDCIAAVWVNGQRVGTADNMLIPHRFPVGGALRAGANEIVVGIDSAVLAGRGEIPPGDYAMPSNWESLTVRKASHMYGWDICPRIVSAGLWRGVRVEFRPPTRFRSVYLATRSVDVEKRAAQLVLDWDFAATVFAIDGWAVRFTLARGGKTAFTGEWPVLGTHGRQEIEMDNVDCWWPRGAGEPALYDARIELLDENGALLDEQSWRAGVRTIHLERSELLDEQGEGEFTFHVNGQKIFIQGTNWVPLDCLHSRDPEHLATALAMAADLNCNMLRCWGGNVYESDAFFDRCDELGIMVWQDFAFACALYPQTREFHAAAAREAEAIIRQLRHHASLALWAGNNEIDVFYTGQKPGYDPNVDDRLSREVLPAAARRFDPWREYLPSSPYLSPALWAMGAPEDRRPEDHLWGPRDDYKGPYYAEAKTLFASETGYHGCPSRSTLERLIEPDHLWPWQRNGQTDRQWRVHAATPMPAMKTYDYRITLMAAQVKLLFGREPATLDDFIFASQFSQAEAKKFFVERFRADFGRPHGRAGILWWNLRDGWPLISDAVVDYYGTRKLAYAVLKRVQADVAVMVLDAAAGDHAVWAVNGTPTPARGTVTARRLADGERPAEILWEGTFEAPPFGHAPAGELPRSDRPAMVELRWRADGREGEGVNHYLAGPRPFDLAQCRAWYADLGLTITP